MTCYITHSTCYTPPLLYNMFLFPLLYNMFLFLCNVLYFMVYIIINTTSIMNITNFDGYVASYVK